MGWGFDDKRNLPTLTRAAGLSFFTHQVHIQVALSRHENGQPTHIGWKASSGYGVFSSVTALLESHEIPYGGTSS